jgi:hypothetical protein
MATRARPKISETALRATARSARSTPLLHEERRVLPDVLERERRERLEAQKKAKQLMREYLSLELERALQRLTEEQGLER